MIRGVLDRLLGRGHRGNGSPICVKFNPTGRTSCYSCDLCGKSGNVRAYKLARWKRSTPKMLYVCDSCARGHR